jgi:hypothetical protein
MSVAKRLLRCGISIPPLSALGQEQTAGHHAAMSAQSGQIVDILACPLRAKSGLMQCSINARYSII